MPTNIQIKVQDAVVQFITESCPRFEYHPRRLPWLDKSRWSETTEDTTDFAADSAQKLAREAYRQLGKTVLEHGMMLLMAETLDLFDKPIGYAQMVKDSVLSQAVLTLVLKRIDSRLLVDVADVRRGFDEFVGKYLADLNYNTTRIAAWLRPLFGPLLAAAGKCYMSLKSVREAEPLISERYQDGFENTVHCKADSRRSPVPVERFGRSAEPGSLTALRHPSSDSSFASEGETSVIYSGLVLTEPAVSPTSFVPQTSVSYHREILSEDIYEFFKTDSDSKTDGNSLSEHIDLAQADRNANRMLAELVEASLEREPRYDGDASLERSIFRVGALAPTASGSSRAGSGNGLFEFLENSGRENLPPTHDGGGLLASAFEGSGSGANAVEGLKTPNRRPLTPYQWEDTRKSDITHILLGTFALLNRESIF
ncbi:hypothetical protein B0H19DRAFT_1061419 [Mycena capillaripes]|nr:hypothetical protein B0H19DRAFT_1061419 [Mycena capillaripes]